METVDLTYNGLIFPIELLKKKLKKHYDLFLNKLTLTYQGKVGPPKTVYLYKKVLYKKTPCLILPRTLIKFFVDNKLISKVNIKYKKIININIELKNKLFDNQLLIMNYLIGNCFTISKINTGQACAVINLRAGMGKTFVAAGLINHFKYRTLVIVPKKPLQVQAIKDFKFTRKWLRATQTSPYNEAFGRYATNLPSSSLHMAG
jgi:hypothetical protein